MRNAILPLTLVGVLALSGCADDRGFDVTGTVPASESRPVSQPAERPHAAPQPTFPTAQRTSVTPTAQDFQTPVRESTASRTPPASTPASPSPAPTKVTVTPDTTLAGKVISVNANLRFVVVNFPVGHMASVDQQLNVYRQGQKVGAVKITGPQQDDNIIADISDGEVQAGDEVREN